MTGALLGLQALEVLFLALHDWVPLGKLTNRAAVQGADSTGRLLWTTAWSTAPYAFGLAASVHHWPRWPAWLVNYLLVSYAVLLAGALWSWWVPYLFGAEAEKAARFRARFHGTWGFLPERHGIRPDGLHCMFHASVVLLLALLGKVHGTLLGL